MLEICHLSNIAMRWAENSNWDPNQTRNHRRRPGQRVPGAREYRKGYEIEMYSAASSINFRVVGFARIPSLPLSERGILANSTTS
jgi:hypothetical protein